MAKNIGTKFFILFFLSLVIKFILLDLIFPLKFNIEYSPVVLARDSTILYAFLTSDDKWRMMTELQEITPTLRKAILYKEDKYFNYHFGINPVAICRAMYNNLVTGKRTSGASTITMQVARMLEPKKRSYFNKLIEMFRALQLEFHYSKDEILQLYLNLIPYGSNIEGVKSASLLYFDKAPNYLSIAEITTLAIIPNRPTTLQLGKNNALIKQERDKWLNMFMDAELFDEKYITDALDEPLTAYRHEAPKLAPHLSMRIRNMWPGRPILHTELDLEIQLKLEKLVRDYIQRLYSINIKNGAVLVINNQTRTVTAYIGSADFYNTVDGGQVDGIRAVRSPGSLLKPLLYAVAIDNGLITPKTVISDVAVSFKGYEPENYDGKYHGSVSVEYALINSLNVPAVKILNRLKPDILTNRLITAGFKTIEKDKNKLGLSLALGGCGTTLEELTGLFSSFADTGCLTGFKWLYNDTASYRKKIISSGAAYMITEILTKLTRPDLPVEWQNTANLPRVAWKTGTSYGRKDAWSIGYNRKYTVGVWVGNFSGQGIPELSGADCAAPLLFHIFNIIDQSCEKEWYFMPQNTDIRYVCSESGMPPNEFCTNLVMDYYIPMVSSNKKCTHKKYVWISPDSSVSYCSTCMPETNCLKVLYNNYPPEIIAYFEQNQIQYKKIPPHNPQCERIFAENAPVITSPVDGTQYFINADDSMQVLLSCNTAGEVDSVYWYINNRFYKSCGATDILFFDPPPGRVKISCSDDKGRNTDIFIIAKEINF